ncbi:ATP-dependent helicase [Catenulispora yoronensis]|uniref:ATP-dependent helicase n=2 Tax=Catenulispora yoronensis TaxID=450799 RepID=A0ABN2UT75_9ACTN
MKTSAALDHFHPATKAWFTAAFADPTAAQAGAWNAVAAEKNALVVAPTGSGKTLAAFLAALDRLAFGPPPTDAKRRCRVVYVSPLKALAVDVERNLRAPLAGLKQAAARLGLPEPDVDIAVRSGDTPADQRRRFVSKPSDILITTPESLFLLLTSAARESLRGVETVIIDEVHAVAGTKRGSHLAVSLERLDALLERPARRIGLSATVRPAETVAQFLGGPHPVEIVAPKIVKTFDIKVSVPVEDMGALDTDDGERVAADQAGRRTASVWPHVEAAVAALIEQHRSTIVFTNSRRLAERLTGKLNEAHWERVTGGVLDAPLPIGQALSAPAELMAQAGSVAGAPPVLARAHHGSVSKEQRADIEEALKAGNLPAVVATSSLELGIDMGAVDLVVQVESPPSVAAGLQRVGRAGHQVGAVSRGVIFPKYRGDLVQSAVVAERMVSGSIEALKVVRNPLDVLAQQIIAMVAVEDWAADDLIALVRRSMPFSALPDSAYESVLDLLSGRYPSDEFAELKPRIVWDRVEGRLSARPGAQRLAVTSGGTIPDRGYFGVFLAGAEIGAKRVGELDEEMVYESRVGDVFTLGSSSWRIEDITHDRVIVSPAPGMPGKLPFWHGDALGRPLELGRALGGFLRELGRTDEPAAKARLAASGLDEWAADNLLSYLREQKQATGRVPDDRTIVVERTRDELGDWKILVHSPFGAQVHAPWALAIGTRLRERYGLDAQVMHADDGIVLRLPDTDAADPTTESLGLLFGSDEIEEIVTGEIGGSALFASRFRECAGRALLLPRTRPGKRTPLWQQRQRSAQLLSVAAKHASFPIVLEAVREVLQDVYDVPGLIELCRDIEARKVRIVEVETAQPSPFARSLLFGYIAQFMYEGDSPLAERRAAALSLDPALLAELLGQTGLRDLLDPEILAALEEELQYLTPTRRARDAEDAADLLRLLGPLSTAEAAARGIEASWLVDLEGARRVIRVRIAGQERWAAIEDAGRLQDALGVPLPVGIPEAFTAVVADPLGDLVARYARTHGPFNAIEPATRFGIPASSVIAALERLAAAGRVLSGEFRPGGSGTEWCDAEVLRRVRRRTMAALRKEAEPVAPQSLALLLPAWQSVGRAAASPLRGVDGVLRVVEQLAGAVVPASALERLILPSRVADYSPTMLDELTSSGEVVWAGAGSLAGDDGWVTLCPAELAPLLLAEPSEALDPAPVHRAILEALGEDAALFLRGIVARVGEEFTSADVLAGLWDLLWAGYITNDTLAPLRGLLGSGKSAHKTRRPTPRGRYARLGVAAVSADQKAQAAISPSGAGRWSRLEPRVADPTRRAHLLGEVLLDRYGVVTRGSVMNERIPGGYAGVYSVLSAYEEAGRSRRGYFVEGLGAAQFAAEGAVDRLRALAATLENLESHEREAAAPALTSDVHKLMGVPHDYTPHRPAKTPEHIGALVLAATDPANAYGAALPWPARPVNEDGVLPTAHKPGRKAGALVVLVNGALTLYVERGGRTLLSWTDDPATLQSAADALALTVRDGWLGKLTVSKTDGEDVLNTGRNSALTQALAAAGFRSTPSGLRLRG